MAVLLAVLAPDAMLFVHTLARHHQETAMAEETIGEYVIEYSGVQLVSGDGWGAYVTIYGPSPNPMHRIALVSEQRVAVDIAFPTESAAAEEARRAALSMLAE